VGCPVQGKIIVIVEFRTHKLRKQYEDHREAERTYEAAVARKYIERINIIKQSRNIEELRKLPRLDCHPLKGDRKREWAIKLTGFYRLIFTLKGECLEIAHIEEVSKHYGD